MSININDKFIIKHGSNNYGHGTALFITKKITKNGNIYGEKWNKSMNKLINNNYKLESSYILSEAK